MPECATETPDAGAAVGRVPGILPVGALPVLCVSPEEAGRLLGLSRWAGWDMVRSGVLPSIHVGREGKRRVVALDDLRDYIEARKAAEADAATANHNRP